MDQVWIEKAPGRIKKRQKFTKQGKNHETKI